MGASSVQPGDLQAAIELAQERFGDPPEDINNGLCGDFADMVCWILSDTQRPWYDGCPAPPDGVRLFGTPGGCDGPAAHTWIVGPDGRHYDAEVPEGVSHASKLPIFERYREWRQSR